MLSGRRPSFVLDGNEIPVRNCPGADQPGTWSHRGQTHVVHSKIRAASRRSSGLLYRILAEVSHRNLSDGNLTRRDPAYQDIQRPHGPATCRLFERMFINPQLQ